MRGIDFNYNWKFSLNYEDGIHFAEYDDSKFETVTIPHDWSIGFGMNKEKGVGCTGYYLGGIGWYRKHFITTKEMINKDVWVNFDGIYNRANIYCNGELLTFHPYGYSPCLVNLTNYLNEEGKDNVITVKVDHSRYADSRWYTGSGIYRKVSMVILPKLNIPIWGQKFTTSDITKESGKIKGVITLNNEYTLQKNARLEVKVYDGDNNIVGEANTNALVDGNSKRDMDVDITVFNPVLWDVFKGNLYKIETKLFLNGECIQTEKAKIGFREFHFDNNKGFFLNGKNIKIKGICIHHDCGLTGSAVPLDVWKDKLTKLMSCGCNAIRISHNPSSEDFLDLCDELGLLIQEEFYDEWDNPKDKRYNGTEKNEYADYITRGHAEFFQEYAKEDLQNVIKRDYNHPCIFQWSIGNEIEWTYPKYNAATGYFGADATGGYFFTLPPYSVEKIRENIKKLPMDKYEIGATAHKLSKWTKEMDKTRPVIANCILPSASYESGYTDALDIVGCSYRRVIYNYAHKNYPEKPIMGTENVGQWHEWKAVLDNDFIAGMFIWVGMPYLGEVGKRPFDKVKSKDWPQRGNKSGLIDFAGFERPSYYMFKSLWKEEIPTIHLYTQTLEKSVYTLDENKKIVEKVKDSWQTRLWPWQEVNPYWEYEEDELIAIEAYTNCDEAILFVNDKEVSKQKLSDNEDHIIKWAVPYKAGEVKVIGYKDGKEAASYEIITPSTLKKVLITTDKNTLYTNVDSAAHIRVQLADENGNVIEKDEQEVEFLVEGDYINTGVDNGSIYNTNNYKTSKVMTYNGKALQVLQSMTKGELKVKAKVNDILSDEIIINVVE